MLTSLQDYFLIYRWRKIALISTIILSTLSIIFSILWILSFLNYEIAEINFMANQIAKSTEQKELFLGLNITNLFFLIAILFLNNFGLVLLSKNKYHGYIFLRITTFLTFIIITILILLISIKPQVVSQEIEAANGFITIKYLSLPNYEFAWICLIAIITISLLSIFSRNNYGFLIKNK